MRIRSEATRASIIAAARTLFLQRGYVDATVDDIAAAAEVTKRTMYGYYPTKQALFRGVIESTIDESAAFPEVNPASIQDVREILLEIGRGVGDTIARPEYIQLLRVIVTEIPKYPELGELFERGITPRALQATMTLFQRANAAKLTDIAYPEIVARQFVGGFAVRILFEGLLGAGNASISQMSQSELENYVDNSLFANRLARDRSP